jgi:prevent-host-death family protein
MSERKSATKRAAEATAPFESDEAGTMTVGVRDLRDHLSRYLAEVKAGRSIAVTEHGTVIGTIVPMRFSARTMQLYREGKVNLPTLPKLGVDDFQRIHVEGGIQDILREVKDG